MQIPRGCMCRFELNENVVFSVSQIPSVVYLVLSPLLVGTRNKICYF